MGQPQPLFLLFLVLSCKQDIFYSKSMWKMSKCPSNIWRRDSNPQPFKHESSPITTRPGLPLSAVKFYGCLKWPKINLKNIRNAHFVILSRMQSSFYGREKDFQNENFRQMRKYLKFCGQQTITYQLLPHTKHILERDTYLPWWRKRLIIFNEKTISSEEQTSQSILESK